MCLKNLGLISNFFRLSLETFSSSCVWLLLVNPSKNFRPSSKLLGNRLHNNLGLISNFFCLLLETFSSSLILLILANPSKNFRPSSKILGNRRHNNLGLISNFFRLLLETFLSSLIWPILAKPSKKFRSSSKILGNRRHNIYLGHLVIYVLINNWISIQIWVWGRRKKFRRVAQNVRGPKPLRI